MNEAHQADVFGIETPQIVLATNQWPTLLALVAAVRTARTAQKIGGGRPLLAVHLDATVDERAQIDDLIQDWLAASRAEELLVDNRGGLDWHDVAGSNMKVAIVPVPQELPA